MIRRLLSFFLVLVLAVPLYASDPDTINTVPAATSSFLADLQTFLREEDGDRLASLWQASGSVALGGTHATGAGLTKTPDALTAYPSGIRITETGSIVYADDETTWAIACRTTTGNLGTFTRVSGTHYLIDAASASKPVLPTNCVWLMQVVTAGGAVSTVTDLRNRVPHVGGEGTFEAVADLPAAGIRGRLAFVTATSLYYFDNGSIWIPFGGIVPSYTLAGLPAAGTAGRLARVTDDVRGMWIDTGSEWIKVVPGVVAGDFGFLATATAAANTTALNAAITVAPVGGLIIINSGTFNLDVDSVTISKELTIRGASRIGTIIQGSGGVMFTVAADRVKFQDLRIFLNASNALNVGISIPAQRALLTVREVDVIGTSRTGIGIRSTGVPGLLESTFTDIWVKGFNVGISLEGTEANANHVTDSLIEGNLVGIDLVGVGQYLTVKGSIIQSSGTNNIGIRTTPTAGQNNGLISISNHYESDLTAGTINIKVVDGGGGSGLRHLSIGDVFAGATDDINAAIGVFEVYGGTGPGITLSGTARFASPNRIQTWTPVLTFITPGNLSVVYTTQVGRFIRIGRQVTVQFHVVTSTFTHTTASGSVLITGLPYVSANTTGLTYAGALHWQGITNANLTHISTRIEPNESRVRIQGTGSGVALTSIAATDMPTGGTVILRGGITYFILD